MVTKFQSICGLARNAPDGNSQSRFRFRSSGLSCPGRSGYRSKIMSSGFVPPWIPTRAIKPPAGPDWVHAIKHDGYRLQVRGLIREGTGGHVAIRGPLVPLFGPR
jgi:hypothetical protein